MTHIPIDKSNLPRVNEVCRDFAVLEDGALAHCLQEQEIEQHYASNVRKNKLVQKDIRIAKRLQDEEDQQSKVFSLEQQKQIEELDSEYARAVQEELRRKAQECLQREEEDKIFFRFWAHEYEPWWSKELENRNKHFKKS